MTSTVPTQDRGPSDDGGAALSFAVVLFDGHCGLCDGSVDFILRRDRRARFRFAALQSQAARALFAAHGTPRPDTDSLLLLEQGVLHAESEAVLRIARGLGLPWSLLGSLRLVPRAPRDALYRWVARHRYRWFGQRSTCRIPDPEQAARFLEDPQP